MAATNFKTVDQNGVLITWAVNYDCTSEALEVHFILTRKLYHIVNFLITELYLVSDTLVDFFHSYLIISATYSNR